MPRVTEIEEIIAYRQYLAQRLEQLKEELAFVTKQLEQLDQWMPPQTTAPPPVLFVSYQKNETWARKVEFVLTSRAKAMTVGEIVEEIIRLEPELKDKVKSTISSVSSMLLENSKDKGKFSKQKGENGYEYRLK